MSGVTVFCLLLLLLRLRRGDVMGSDLNDHESKRRRVGKEGMVLDECVRAKEMRGVMM